MLPELWIIKWIIWLLYYFSELKRDGTYSEIEKKNKNKNKNKNNNNNDNFDNTAMYMTN